MHLGMTQISEQKAAERLRCSGAAGQRICALWGDPEACCEAHF